MVRQGAFEVQLVEACSKNPFPEHTKDGMHFIEAEPNAEYYIRLEWLPCGSSSYSTSPYLRTTFKVDSRDLGTTCAWDNRRDRGSGFNYFGPKSYPNGTETVQSLRFSLPDRFQQENQSFSRESYLEKMGRVEVHIYEGNILSHCTQNMNYICSNQKSSFQHYHEENALVAPVLKNGGEKKKFVLSKPGRQSMPDARPRVICRWGKCIDVITLRYSTAHGLILAGVISNPLSSTWQSGIPARRSITVSPEGSPNSSNLPNYHTEMQRIVGDPTPDGNVPHRTVEVIVIDDGSDESDFDDDDDDDM